jgi:hypothetical protein
MATIRVATPFPLVLVAAACALSRVLAAGQRELDLEEERSTPDVPGRYWCGDPRELP